ncbi:MAG: HAD family hydrolase [Thermomicrobiales bacterium]
MAPPSFDPPPLAVLFDLDDTLCDYMSAREARLRIAFAMTPDGDVASREGIDLDQMIADSIRIHPHGADHFAELFRAYGIDDPAQARAAADWYRQNRFHGLALYPESRAVLRAVRPRLTAGDRLARQPIGIITNGPSEVQRAKLDLLKIDDLVDFAVISEEFGAAKPDPSIFHEALHQAGVLAAEAVFIGDSPEFDMAGARAAGIRSVWLNRHNAPWNDPDWTPDREIQSLLEFRELIEPG